MADLDIAASGDWFQVTTASFSRRRPWNDLEPVTAGCHVEIGHLEVLDAGSGGQR